MDRSGLVLAILACAEGRPYTPVQLQKSVFLAVRNIPGIISWGPSFNFVPYDYGPFDADVYTVAQMLAAEGLAVVAPSSDGRWSTYAATSAGQEAGKRLLAQLPEVTRDYLRNMSEWVRAQSFRGLISAIYRAYPEMAANSVFRG